MSSAAGEPLSNTVRWRLTETLFKQKAILIVGGLVLPAVGVFGFSRTGRLWFLLWAASALLVLGFRLGIDAAFAQRGSGARGPQVWERRFLAGTWLSGTLCGVGGAGAILGADPATQMLVITTITAFVMGSAARNAALPAAAIGSVLLAELPLIGACLSTRQADYVIYAGFIVCFTMTGLSVTRHIYEQTLAFLRTDEEKALLVDEVRRSNLELAAANERLQAIARTDGLTGVPNRRSFDAAIERETRRVKRDASVLSLLLLDIDHFKSYNDSYGHQAGDDCLRRVAATLQTCLHRSADSLARYGGEEFVAILPGTDVHGAAALADEMRRAIEALGIENTAVPTRTVTVSIGVATISNHDGGRGNQLIRLADEALYAAKSAGRNRVVVAGADRSSGRHAIGTAEEVARP